MRDRPGHEVCRFRLDARLGNRRQPAVARACGPARRAAIPEASGIVKSRRHPGIFWVHNDSGNAPLLFAIRADGQIVRQFRLDVPNIDWEDIAIDDQGTFTSETSATTSVPFPFVRSIASTSPTRPCRLPSGRSRLPPCRVIAFRRAIDSTRKAWTLTTANAIVIAKYLDGREAEVFAVPFGAPAPLTRPTEPRSLGRLAGFIEPATGSDPVQIERTWRFARRQ